MNIYYVYAYLRKDGTPYYIGKGKGRRHIAEHKVVVPTDSTRIIFLAQNLNEFDAFELEKYYIQHYGRKDLGTGILRNLTDGGEGASGCVRSNEYKEKLRRAKTGIARKPETIEKIKLNCARHVGNANGMFGKQHSDHTRELIRQKSLGRKHSAETNAKKGHVLDKNGRAKSVMTPMGKFTTITLAARTLGVNYHTILNRVKSNSEQFAGYFWL